MNAFSKCILLSAPHILTLLFAVGYLVLGGYIFCTIEGWADSSPAVSANSSSTVTDHHHDQQLSAARTKLDSFLPLFLDSEEEEMYKREFDYFLRTYYHRKETESTTKFEGWTLLDGFLYSYSSVTTIGYSHLATRTDFGRLFFVFYNIVGIPLCSLVLADWGMILEELLIWLCRSIFLRNRSRSAASSSNVRSRNVIWWSWKPFGAPAESIIYLPLVLCVYLAYVAFGGVLLPFWERGWSFVEAMWVAFDGTTTIGIGDIYPRNERYFLATLAYMSLGIAIAAAAIAAMGDYLRVLHYAGRRPGQCGLQVLWFGGKHLRADEFVRVLGKQFGATEYEIRNVQGRLDDIVNRAIVAGNKRGEEGPYYSAEEAAAVTARRRTRNKRNRPSSYHRGGGGGSDRWHDSVITPLTLVPVQNAATSRVGSVYACDLDSNGN